MPNASAARWATSSVPTRRATSSPEAGAVLVTRPEPGAADTAARLAARGYRPVLAPLMSVERRYPALPHDAQAILVTSANALDDGLPDLRLLAVGDATAARARTLGFSRVLSAGRDAVALAALAARECRPSDGPLLLLSGAGQGRELAAALRAAGFRVLRRVTYVARPARALPAAALAMLRGGAGHVLFFSPDTARVFIRLTHKVSPKIDVTRLGALAISAATREPLSVLPWLNIEIASHPNQDALLALLP
jgi:uroporphyrinogen-III synthase